MKPDFEKLAIEWKDHAVGLVAGIDCTEEDELCQKLDVQGFPTLVYGDPSDPEVSSQTTVWVSLSSLRHPVSFVSP
jgi:thiol-disulfide isomerase/thioredoxin